MYARKTSTGDFLGKSLAMHQVRRSSSVILSVDSGYSLISWKAATDTVANLFENPKREGNFYLPGLSINKERTLFSGCERDAVEGRHHNKTVNVAFVDGHVQCLGADSLLIESWLYKRSLGI